MFLGVQQEEGIVGAEIRGGLEGQITKDLVGHCVDVGCSMDEMASQRVTGVDHCLLF